MVGLSEEPERTAPDLLTIDGERHGKQLRCGVINMTGRKPSWLRRILKQHAAIYKAVEAEVYEEAKNKSEPIVIVQGAFNGTHSTGFRPSRLDYNGSLTYLNAPPKDLEATMRARRGLGPNQGETGLRHVGVRPYQPITAERVKPFDRLETNTYTDQVDIDMGRPLSTEQETFLFPDPVEVNLVRVGTFKNGKPKYKEVGKPDAVPKFRTAYRKRPRIK